MSQRTYPDMWVDPEDDPRQADAPPGPSDERTTLKDYLRAYRLTLQMKCADLDPEQLARRSVPPSTMSLLGLIRHMADVERNWFRRVMAGEDAPPRFWTKENRDGEFDDAVGDAAMVEEAFQALREEIAFAEKYVAAAESLDVLGTLKNGAPVNLRDVLVHMIEEYARHCGHADLLRECIDGRTGQ